MTTVMNLKAAHDHLLGLKPEGAAHNTATCPLCVDLNEGISASEGGTMSTYTEAQLKEAVDQAVSAHTAELDALKAKVEELKTSALESETTRTLAEQKAEHDAKVAELQAQLDTAVLEAQDAKTKHEALESFLAEAHTAQTAAAEAAARKDERLGKVREAADFPDDYLEAQADRFAAMSDEDFDKALTDWAAIAPKSEGIPSHTALTASRDGSPTPNKGTALVKEVIGFRNQGIDPRNV